MDSLLPGFADDKFGGADALGDRERLVAPPLAAGGRWRDRLGIGLRSVARCFITHVVGGQATRRPWIGTFPTDFDNPLDDFRPSDRETPAEMRVGRFLLAGHLVDISDESPFVAVSARPDWLDDLHSFSWLRHYRGARSEDEQRFARKLVLDWIDRRSQLDPAVWGLSVMARRVLNWLRHLSLLNDGAAPEEKRAIAEALGAQVQALRLRGRIAESPVDRLFSGLAQLGVALCDLGRDVEVARQIRRVEAELNRQIGADGLHRSRSAQTQFMLLVEIENLARALDLRPNGGSEGFLGHRARMHAAFAALSLGTGEAAYFNGAGPMPYDVVVALRALAPVQALPLVVVGGYARLASGTAVVVADSGLAPPPSFARALHASALAFEFSHGHDLVVGNCGPGRAEHAGEVALFREGIAHSGPTINAQSGADLEMRGPRKGGYTASGEPSRLAVDGADHALLMRTHGFAARFGVALERRLTLLSDGQSLVGHERIVKVRYRISGVCSYRFHLAYQTGLEHGEDILRLRLASGRVWTFLWEGAEMRVEDSIRNSAFGARRTKQIVLDTPVEDGAEVSWIFALSDG